MVAKHDCLTNNILGYHLETVRKYEAQKQILPLTVDCWGVRLADSLSTRLRLSSIKKKIQIEPCHLQCGSN